MDNEVRAFSPRQFQRAYGIGNSLFYKEIKAGRLRARKIGRRTVISLADAEAWLSNGLQF